MRNIFQILIFLLLNSGFAIGQLDELDYKKYDLNDIEIDFINSHSFDKSDIKILTKTGKLKYFDYNEFCSDILRIEKFYFDNGYIDASVDTNISINEEKKEITAKFIVDEKQPYTLGSIEYYGANYLLKMSRLLRQMMFIIKIN